MIDYHIHSNFSSDSTMDMDSACKRAIALGLTEIAFTDHIDIDYPDPIYTFQLNIPEYLEAIERAQHLNRDIKIRKGIEVGIQPHVLDDTLDLIKDYTFDFVIASVHGVNGEDLFNGEYFRSRTTDRAYEDFFRELLAMVEKFSVFNVIGHLDSVALYNPQPLVYNHCCDELLDRLLMLLISRGKGLEINTSGYRRQPKGPIPSLDIIKRYHRLGGEIITMGSDAHRLQHIGFKFEPIFEKLKEMGIKYITTFEEMKPKQVPIP
ncbi:MAG TPA: histidinol-phosphatase HisJ family protein [Clostridiales bacterium]|nr:histidinol-phosphatase HisJ family protein [Clostridiales bacterium]